MLNYATTHVEYLTGLRIGIEIYVSSLWANQINRFLVTIEDICLPLNTFFGEYGGTLSAWVTLKPTPRRHCTGCFHGEANGIHSAHVALVHGIRYFC